MARKHASRAKLFLPDLHKKVADGSDCVVGVKVGHRAPGPNNARMPDGRPDSIEVPSIGRGEFPHADEVGRRRTYDLNVELANYLSRNLTVVVGGALIRSFPSDVIRKNNKRR